MPVSASHAPMAWWHSHRGPVAAFAAACLLAAAPAGAHESGAQAALDNSGDYRQEVKACREGRTGEDRATCLREARNARADKRRGVLTTTGSLRENALARCAAHHEKVDIDACRERVQGSAQVTGSVAGGGLLREYVVTLPQEPAPHGSTEMGGPGMNEPCCAPGEATPSTPATPQEPESDSQEAPGSADDPEAPQAPQE